MKWLVIVWLGAIFSVRSIAAADSIAIDWYGGGKNEGTSQTRMMRSEVAGVVPQQHWNSFYGVAEGSGRSLVDNHGERTTASVTWRTEAVWDSNGEDTPGNLRMMLAYLSHSTEPVVVNVYGIPPAFLATGYDVYVYSDGDNNAEARTARFTIGSAEAINIDPARTNFSGTFVEGTNYVCLRGLTAKSFTLTATPVPTPGTTTLRAPVNGIQIVQRAPAAKP